MFQRMFAAGVCLCLAVAGLAQGEWKLSGYVQARVNVWDESVKDDALDLRRVYVKVEGPLGDLGTLKLQVDLSGLDDEQRDLIWKDAVLTRRLSPQATVALGFQPVAFGWEVPTSNATLFPLERSEAAKRLFPGERAIGLFLGYKPQPASKRWPQVDLAYTGGISQWYDTDARGNEDTHSRAALIRVQGPLGGRKGAVAGVSFMAAQRKRRISGTETDWGAENVGSVHCRAPLGSQAWLTAEYYKGEYNNTDAEGFYGMLEYVLPKTPVTLFYRYDTFDRGAGNDYQRHTAGAAWRIGRQERLTVQWEAIENYNGDHLTNYSLQYQRQFEFPLFASKKAHP